MKEPTTGNREKRTAGRGTAACINFWRTTGNSSVTDWWTAGNQSINEKNRRLSDRRESRDGFQINFRDHRAEGVGFLDLHDAPTVGRRCAGESGDYDALVKGVDAARVAGFNHSVGAFVPAQQAGGSTSGGDAGEIGSTRFIRDQKMGEAEDAGRCFMGMLLLPDDFYGSPCGGWLVCSRYTHLARLLQAVDSFYFGCAGELAGSCTGGQDIIAGASRKRSVETRDATGAWILPARQGQGAGGAESGAGRERQAVHCMARATGQRKNGGAVADAGFSQVLRAARCRPGQGGTQGESVAEPTKEEVSRTALSACFHPVGLPSTDLSGEGEAPRHLDCHMGTARCLWELMGGGSCLGGSKRA